jgi:hypothetical protein
MGKDAALVSADEEFQIYQCAAYIADITLLSLREVFVNAKRIMDWLAIVASKVAKKVSPQLFLVMIEYLIDFCRDMA